MEMIDRLIEEYELLLLKYNGRVMYYPEKYLKRFTEWEFILLALKEKKERDSNDSKI